jgi:hypothetical protein
VGWEGGRGSTTGSLMGGVKGAGGRPPVVSWGAEYMYLGGVPVEDSGVRAVVLSRARARRGNKAQ